MRDLRGQTFGNLTVLEYAGCRPGYNHLWRCRCICGKEKDILHTIILYGKGIGCGCQRKPMLRHGMKKTKFYKIWENMKSRCNNPNHKNYKYWGGKGIVVDNRWNNFKNFMDDTYDGYLEHIKLYGEKQTTLDRIDSTGNYSKENCRRATYYEQGNNRVNNIAVYYNNKYILLNSLCKKLGLDYVLLYTRLKRGMTIYQAINTKKRNK